MIKNTKKILKLGILLCLFLPFISKAETHISGDDLRQNWVWDEAGSPYILEDSIYIPRGSLLYIKEGVEVIPAQNEYEDIYSITVGGEMTVAGTEDKPVVFRDMYTIYFLESTSRISHAVLENTGLDFVKSTSTLDFVEVKGAFSAIESRGSRLDITNSFLHDNSYGIASYKQNTEPIFQVNVESEHFGLGGNGEIEDVDISQMDPLQNIIHIKDSSILENKNYNIINNTQNTVDARDNWWGSKNGPEETVSGLVSVSPWKDSESPVDLCCSSVLFLPGLEASRLYKDEKGLLGTSTNTLWEPNRNDDVMKMYMDEYGVSIDSSIYTKDIMSSAYGIKNIYKSFEGSMDDLVTNGFISSWLAIPYDWRKSVSEIVDDAFLSKVYALASTSKTGKVFIIAHSNGGLLTKVLSDRLESEGYSDLVSDIVYVAVPELGSPQAILGMLHGYGQSIGLGALLSESTARDFSKNLPSAYGLLPSRGFFEKGDGSIDNSPVIIDNFSDNPKKIMSYESMKDFLLSNPFSEEKPSNTSIPSLVNPYLLSLADSLHLYFDSWKPASSTKVSSILGSGVPTIDGLLYEDDTHCKKDETENCKVSFSPTITRSGDGTVMTKSSTDNTDSKIFFDLVGIKKDTKKNIQHANILESIPLLEKIVSLITRDEQSTREQISTDFDDGYEKYFSDTEPVYDDKYLTIKVYSPVDIDVYDQDGNHTGIVANPESEMLFSRYEEEIPGSYYGDFGDVKILEVPYGENYKITLKGNDVGVFVTKMEVKQNDEVIASSTFAEMPVTPLMNVDVRVPSSIEDFATSTVMNIDINGDGDFDLIQHSNEFLGATSSDMIPDLSTYLDFIRQTIISLELPSKVEDKWITRIDKIEGKIENKKPRKIKDVIKKFLTKKIKSKKLTETQKTTVTMVFDELLVDLENSRKN